MNYEQAMEYIKGYSKSGGKIRDLSRAEKLMDHLGNPQKGMKFVHIAGTNGKGSVVEMMSGALINAGYVTGQFTSPFIRCYEDRIRVNGENIPSEDIAELCTLVAEAAADDQYSQFEITMAIAMLYYKKRNCDIVFLEAGIGGLLDSTNIIEDPLVCVITSISLDHTAILGATVEQIAMQKAGIIKPSRPVVVSWNNKNVLNIFEKECIFKNSELIVPDQSEFEDSAADADGCRFTYKGSEYRIKMHGRHQIINAASALKALEIVRNEGFEISDDDIKSAFAGVQVPSRMEVFKGTPDVILDGGHNPAGVSAMLSTLMSMGVENAVMIFGMVSDKDSEAAAEMISTYAKAVICVDGFAPNAVDRSRLASMIKCEKYQAGMGEAFALAKMTAKRLDAAVVVCGSLYLTSAFRRFVERA